MPETLFLHIESRGRTAARVLELPGDSLRIGRGAQCEVRLGELSLAEVECLLRRRGEVWHIQPLGPPGKLSIDGRQYVRLDVGLDGTVDGIITKTGDYKEYLTNAPDLVFPQTADDGERLFAVAKYERDKGAAMTIVYPRDRSAWNGKMWVTVHGRGDHAGEQP